MMPEDKKKKQNKTRREKQQMAAGYRDEGRVEGKNCYKQGRTEERTKVAEGVDP